MSNKILCIVAHPDDELLGCGGTLIKHIENNDKVDVLILGTGITSRLKTEYLDADMKIDKLRETSKEISKNLGYNVFFENFPDNKFDSISLLDIVQSIEKWINFINPNIIYTHNHGDINIDHRLTFEAVITASRPCFKGIREIYSFETVSSTEWQAPQLQMFKPQLFSVIKDNILDKKMSALRKYKTEMRESPHPRNTTNIYNKAVVWGNVVLEDYCEVFEIIRIIK